jgi:hypothetical protein
MDLEPVVLGRRVLRRGGRREWFSVAHREREAAPVPRDREDRLFQALGRFEENHQMDLATNEACDRWRASARDMLGRVMKGYSKPWAAPELPEGTINLSDPDSRVMRKQGTPPSHEGRLHRSASLSLPVCGRQETRAPLERAPSSCSRGDAR